MRTVVSKSFFVKISVPFNRVKSCIQMLAKTIDIYEMKYLSGVVFRDNFAPKYMCTTPFNITR